MVQNMPGLFLIVTESAVLNFIKDQLKLSNDKNLIINVSGEVWLYPAYKY